MIRLRQSLEAGLRHPLLGPLLLLFLALILAFVVFHTVEHGVDGLLFACVIAAAVALRLVVAPHRIYRTRSERLPFSDRSPPLRTLALLPAIRPPTPFVALPLRR